LNDRTIGLKELLNITRKSRWGIVKKSDQKTYGDILSLFDNS